MEDCTICKKRTEQLRKLDMAAEIEARTDSGMTYNFIRERLRTNHITAEGIEPGYSEKLVECKKCGKKMGSVYKSFSNEHYHSCEDCNIRLPEKGFYEGDFQNGDLVVKNA
jgi:DNA-directed RNA polymerase subunit RPC12/RpoP